MDDNKEYLSLITSQYKGSPKYLKYVKKTLDMISPIVDCLNSFVDIFNLENAKGDQLDKLGDIVGISRILPLDNPDIPSVLDDNTYKSVIRCKILFNQWDGTNEGLLEILKSVLPGIPIAFDDNQDMSISIVILTNSVDDTTKSLISNGYIIPKPAGVSVNYIYSSDPIFSWDKNDIIQKGWDEGTWV